MLWRASDDSIRESVKNAVDVAEKAGFASIALPIIGAGSGGFSASEAERLIVETLNDIDTDVEISVVRYRRR